MARQKLSKEQKEVLLRKFKEDNMQSCGQSTLSVRKAAMEETGLGMRTVNVSRDAT